MIYSVNMTKNEAGLWNWSIYKDRELAEADTSQGYTTEAEARAVCDHFLADHAAGWMGSPTADRSESAR